MQEQHFIIADGHHRFAAAQRYHEERRTAESALVLACYVEAHDPGIVIRPFHRIISPPDNVDLTEWLSAIAAWFDIEETPVGSRSGRDLARSLPTGDQPAAGLILDRGCRFVRLRLRDWDAIEPLIPTSVTGPARQLGVTVLSELLIHRSLGISADTEPDRIDYTTDADEAWSATQHNHRKIAVLLRPIELRQVLAVARAHGTVPAKSTSFIPKVPIGLVLHEY